MLLTALAASVALGSARLSLSEVWDALTHADADPTTRAIVTQIRLPRSLLAAIVGVGLGAAGAAYQAVFRNPLADPFVIGSASGGAAGAVAVIVSGWAGVSEAIGATATGAFAGSVFAVLLVYLIAGAGRGPAESLLLAGATVSTLLGAVVWLLLAFARDRLPSVMWWVMGGLNLSRDTWAAVAVAGPLVAGGVAVLCSLGRPLDALRAGDDTARALGLPVRWVVLVVLVAASVAVAATVAVGGVIGFVGLVAPHLARPLVGASAGRLVPTAGLVGAVLLVLADLAARSLHPSQELPLGAITALAGGPVFLVVLRTNSQRRAAV
ncbi:MAG: iron ABC transporter permease [Fimbriiglobus sp.]|nr:iron ABC transporter permease [Fimbriiglobus sp.]